jgi:hypothetical protein
MPTLSHPKKAIVRRSRTTASKQPTDARFPGLVRDPLTGLLVRPLAPGKNPVALSAITKALAEAL